DETTRLDLVLEEAPVQLEEVVVSAKRPVVEVNRTSTVAIVPREEIQKLPVQELQDVVNLQAGVVDGHFRGGRQNEVQYQVDGLSTNNAYDNTNSVRVDRSLLEEVQVVSGTFDAEYGQAMSGVVNAVLKRGGERFHWDAEMYTGGPIYSPDAGRIIDDSSIRMLSQTSLQASASGPIFLPNTRGLLSFRYALNDDWIRGEERFSPADRPDTVKSYVTGRDSLVRLAPTGSGEQLALGYTNEWSGVLKLSNRSLSNISIDWQGIVNITEARRSTW